MGLTNRAVRVIADIRWRQSLTIPMNSLSEPGVVVSAIAFTVLGLRRFVLRYLWLPRFTPIEFFTQDPKTGRIVHWDYLEEPYYNKPTLWTRWGPAALLWKMIGGSVPGDGIESKELMPEGFLTGEIGPKEREGKGVAEAEVWQEKILAQRRSGCPFAI